MLLLESNQRLGKSDSEQHTVVGYFPETICDNHIFEIVVKQTSKD